MPTADRNPKHLAERAADAEPGAAQPPATERPRLRWVPVHRLHFLRRNPQYLSPHELAALEASIRRDGFLAPILCRPAAGGGYELLSGNHRVIAARNLGLKRVPALVTALSEAQAARVAVNLNTVHGQPPAMLLAPFLAGLDANGLATVHLPDRLRQEVLSLDRDVAAALARRQPPPAWDHGTPPMAPPKRRRRRPKPEAPVAPSGAAHDPVGRGSPAAPAASERPGPPAAPVRRRKWPWSKRGAGKA